MKFSLLLLTITILLKSDISCFQNINVSEDIDPSPINWTSTFIRATAPEGNLTQGEVVFSTDNSRFQSGFGVDVFYGLQMSLGFQIQVVTAKGWASQYPNGSWFGMARQIIDNEADISLAKTSILPYRAKGLAYLVPTHGLGLYAFFIQPSSNTARNIFLDPFSPSLWITFVATVVILILSLKTLSCLQKTQPSLLSHQDKQLMENSGLWAFYAVSQHGFHSPPHLMSLRIIVITGIIFTLIVYVSYSAQLVTMFAIQSLPIKSIKDLLNHKEIHITIDTNNRAARSIFEEAIQVNTTDKIATILQQRSKASQNFFIPASEGGLLVLKAQGAFFTFKDTFYTTISNIYGPTEDEICKVSSVPVTDAKFRSGLFVAKGSRYKEPFNIKLIAMYSSGLMKRFVANYEETYTPNCNGDNRRSSSSFPIIEMTDVIFAFYELIYGTTFALTILLAELFYSKCLRTTITTTYFTPDPSEDAFNIQ